MEKKKRVTQRMEISKSTEGRVTSHEELTPKSSPTQGLSTINLCPAEFQNRCVLVTPSYLPFLPFLNRSIFSNHPMLGPPLYVGCVWRR